MSADDRKWHFGVLSFTGTGHLNPLLALSQELQRRGHRVTFFEKPKIEDRVRQAGLDFVPIRTGKFLPKGSAPSHNSGILAEISTLRFNLARVRFEIEQYLKETPSALATAGIDALLINEIALTGPTVAQLLRLPYFLIATTVPHHFGWSGRSRSGRFWNGSSWFTGHRASASWISWLESRCLELSALRTHGPIRRALDADRRKLGLGPVRTISKDLPCLAHITQLPQCLDFEHVAQSAGIYYSGPWISPAARTHVDFPWDRIDGRPLIYATLGTTRNVRPSVFRMIAQACADLNLQLVIALGNRMDPELLAGLPGEPLVVRFAPQLELIKLARVVISHAGPNTSFEALMEGKPMIVIPWLTINRRSRLDWRTFASRRSFPSSGSPRISFVLPLRSCSMTQPMSRRPRRCEISFARWMEPGGPQTSFRWRWRDTRPAGNSSCVWMSVARRAGKRTRQRGRQAPHPKVSTIAR